MQQEQIKTLLVNITTGVIVIGVFVAGYIVFIKKDTAVTGSVTSVARIAERTMSIGTGIDYTVRDLRDLTRAVSSSTVIFDLPEFQNLENFSVEIPTETVGRDNPFVPTVWKIKMRALEEAVGKRVVSQSSQQSASVSQTQTATAPQTPAGLLGDFGTGI